MTETAIKYHCTKWLERKGWIAFRLRTPDGSGWPDNFYIRRGKVLFIEYKTPQGTLSDIQRLRINQIQDQGFEVLVIDSWEALSEAYGKRRD